MRRKEPRMPRRRKVVADGVPSYFNVISLFIDLINYRDY